MGDRKLQDMHLCFDSVIAIECPDLLCSNIHTLLEFLY